VVAGETLKVVGLDFGLPRKRMLKICDQQGVRTVRRRPELRAGSEDSTFRLEVGIWVGLSFSMATPAQAGFSTKPALIQKLPVDIPSQIAPNRRRFVSAACLEICKDEIYNRGGTMNSARLRLWSSQTRTPNLRSPHAELV